MYSQRPDGLPRGETCDNLSLPAGTTQSCQPTEAPTTIRHSPRGELYPSNHQHHLRTCGVAVLHRRHQEQQQTQQQQDYFFDMPSPATDAPFLYQSSNREIFPPSPAVSAADFENYSYRGPPSMSASASAGYHPSPLSPRGWPAVHTPWGSWTDQGPGQEPIRPLNSGSTQFQGLGDVAVHSQSIGGGKGDVVETEGEGIISPEMDISLPTFEGYQQLFEMQQPKESKLDLSPHDTIASGLSGYSASVSPSQLSPSTLSSVDILKIDVGFDSGVDGETDQAVKSEPPQTPDMAGSRALQADQTQHQHGQQQQEHFQSQTGDESYAQLIFQALMSVPTHAMDLQEIYQWFRDNTNKAKNHHKGWQNSVRHNLSMNHAFVKRPKPMQTCTPDDMAPVISAGDPRKSTEWVLEDWAIREGVQSTTRYRKGPSHRRAVGPKSGPARHRHVTYRPHHRHPHNSVPGRAWAGHRGGVASGKNKPGSRSTRRPEGYGSASPLIDSVAPVLLGGTRREGRTLFEFESSVSPRPQGPTYAHTHEHPVSYEKDQGIVGAHVYDVNHRRAAHAAFGEGDVPDHIAPGERQHQQQQPPTTFHASQQYGLSDVRGSFSAGRLFEGEDMLYDWDHSNHAFGDPNVGNHP